MANKKPPNCPVEITMQFIGDRWRIIITAYLMLGNKTFMELKESIEEISLNILSRKLTELIDCGVIYKKKCCSDTDKDYYCLTELGESLRGIVDSIYEWGKNKS